MVFTQDEINTTALDSIKEESKSSLRKELEIHIEDFFNNSTELEFEATVKDIKERWFSHNNQISMAYIRKVIKDEMKLIPLPMRKYKPFANVESLGTSGTPFLFKKQNNSQNIDNQVNDVFNVDEPF
jgi:hypothetical protein